MIYQLYEYFVITIIDNNDCYNTVISNTVISNTMIDTSWIIW